MDIQKAHAETSHLRLMAVISQWPLLNKKKVPIFAFNITSEPIPASGFSLLHVYCHPSKKRKMGHGQQKGGWGGGGGGVQLWSNLGLKRAKFHRCCDFMYDNNQFFFFNLL